MILEKNNFIISCDENNSYILEVVDYLESKTNDIMNFFELDSLNSKRKIIIYNNLELYKSHIEQFYEYHDYMCADTNDGNINLLSLEEAHKTKEHEDMTLDELKSTILHEFVHICQQESELEHIDNDIIWFWEALATNLGNPEAFSKVVIKATNEEINNFNSLSQNYPIAFTIGNYMLNNYNHDDILEYVKYPSKLLKDSEKILNSAREWSIIKKISR
ncbi:MAG: hypothetical protein IKN63_04920 [Bacilli bacterium]|nr:hypothetical protein [Bacilli bacterium]